MKKRLAVILLILELAVVGYWLARGAHVWTKTQVQVEVKDELFGTTTTEWKEEFHPGLEYVAPISAVLLIGAAVLFWLARREEKKRLA